MSGHSKWAQIKRKKEITDKKKGLVFGRFSREILKAARAQSDPDKNPLLRDIIARARRANMPQINVDRLLTRSANKDMKEVIYEGFGPGGSAILIFASTDNNNRTIAEVRTIFKNHNLVLGSTGTIKWKFQPQTHIVAGPVPPENIDEITLELIDKGASDITTEGENIVVTAPPNQQQAIATIISNNGFAIIENSIIEQALQITELSDDDNEALHNLLTELQSHPDIADITTDTVE